MDSNELNQRIEALSDTDSENMPFEVQGLVGTGKLVPVIGWYWREVDFDAPIWLGEIPREFVGFMENNKWGYPYIKTTPEETAEIRRLCEAYVMQPTQETAQALFDYLQTFSGRYDESDPFYDQKQ